MNKQYDAIVIGSGITGGWAAKELTEKGLSVLMLERGRSITHSKDYPTEHIAPWDVPFGGMPNHKSDEDEYPVQSRVWAYDETSKHFFVNDKEQPYSNAKDSKPFMWHRTDVLGGKSLVWGRQSYRFSDIDFEANRRDGHGVDWPIRYKDIAPWYSYVERFVGISGEKLGLPQLPDGEFQKPMSLNIVERHVKERLAKAYPDRTMTIGRCAVQTEAKNGRGACHYCGPCYRGCSPGAYFSSLSSTIPAAMATGKLNVKADCVVERIEYDSQTKRANAVHVIDANTLEKSSHTAKLIFLCASTIASTQILLNSRCETFPSGLGNKSGVLGHYLIDHNYLTGAYGVMPGFQKYQPIGNRPNFPYIPRFRNLNGQDADSDFLRGYGLSVTTFRMDWRMRHKQINGFGKNLKQALRTPGPWFISLAGTGEQLPRYENHMRLHETKVDRYGIPQVEFSAAFGENTKKMRKDIALQASKMLKAAGAISVAPYITDLSMGRSVHEMGTARMGDDPSDSVLNKWNQMHGVPNLFVTDGSSMASASCVNPSMTYMALTVRAVDYAVKLFKQNKL